MIKNIIFDVGDVLLEYRWKDMLMDYGLSGEEAYKVGRMMFDDELWDERDLADIKRGDELTVEYMEKYPEYSQVIEWFFSHEEYMHIPRKDIWEKVHKLKEKGYKLYILSNYSESMFIKHTKDADFIKDMDGIVVSYQAHFMKPDHRIYHFLLDKYFLKPDECLFFDDRIENTKAASELGIHVRTVISKEFLAEELDKLLK